MKRKNNEYSDNERDFDEVNDGENEVDFSDEGSPEDEFDEKSARKERHRERRLERRHKRNSRIARGRILKNLFIWFLGVIFLPLAIVGAMFVVPVGLINSGETQIIGGKVYTGSDGEYEAHSDASDESNANYYKDID